MDIEKLSLEEKVDLLKKLVDGLDIVITASYGATGTISSEDVYIADTTVGEFGIIAKSTVIISTNINTG